MTLLPSVVADNIYHAAGLVWLPVAWFSVHKQHRLKTMAFVATCLLTLGTQVELMQSTGYEHGFLPIMDSHVYPRGLLAYSIVIMIFLLLAHYSPRTEKVIFFAAALSVYILAFCFSMLLMAL